MYSIEISFLTTSTSLTIPATLDKLAKKYKCKLTNVDQTISISPTGKPFVKYMSVNYNVVPSNALQFMGELEEPYYVDWIRFNDKRVYSNQRNELLNPLTESIFTIQENEIRNLALTYETRCV